MALYILAAAPYIGHEVALYVGTVALYIGPVALYVGAVFLYIRSVALYIGPVALYNRAVAIVRVATVPYIGGSSRKNVSRSCSGSSVARSN